MNGGDCIRITRSRIAKEVSKKFDIPYRIAADITAEVFEIIKREVSAGNEVMVAGLGKFFLKKREAKRVTDLSRGGYLTIPAMSVPVFVPSDSFRYINSQESDNET